MVEDIPWYPTIKRAKKIASPPKMTPFLITDDHSLFFVSDERAMFFVSDAHAFFFVSDDHVLEPNP